MAKVKIELPAMGEGITEATITKFLKNVGDTVEIDDGIIEIATDKVDSEVVATHDGKIEQILFNEGDTVQVGEVVVIISTEVAEVKEKNINLQKNIEIKEEKQDTETSKLNKSDDDTNILYTARTTTGKILSPLVRSIAKEKGISIEELNSISGSAYENRITKNDLLNYINNKQQNSTTISKSSNNNTPTITNSTKQNTSSSISGNFEIVEMDRMRKLIAEHMIESKKTSAHVCSFVEADVSNIVQWRNKIKNEFQKRYNEKLTFTPILIEAIVQALKEFPMINVSVENNNIIVKKDINIGIATALPNGNLIVPIIKKAAGLSLLGIAQQVNLLSNAARNNKLQPSDIQGGTFTVTNMGTFGNITGTPIINQPEVAIIALGAIKKKPAVIETPQGDTIGIRHIMVISMSYDHRVVDGALGGLFIKRVADLLENFDTERNI